MPDFVLPFFFFYTLFIYLFIFLAASGLHCGTWDLFFVAVGRLFVVVVNFSLVAKHGLQSTWAL